MRENLTQILARYRRAFGDFTNGQKAVAIVGTAALVLAAFLVFRWISAPSYAPLYTNLSSTDASSVIDALNKDGTPYKLADDGATIMVPSGDVYSTRIALAGENLPAGNTAEDGYGLLNNESISTSDFQQQTDLIRATDGELNSTLEAMTGIQTAIVHLSMPQQQSVFTTEQSPVTASVLLELQPGITLTQDQVNSVVHLVASAVDGLKPGNVTVTDQNGDTLNAPTAPGDTTAVANSQNEQTVQFEDQVQSKLQTMVDRLVGAGNSVVTVTAQLNYNQVKTNSTTYATQSQYPASSQSSASAQYTGAALGGGIGGVVGPNGQMEPGAGSPGGNVSFSTSSENSNNLVNETQQAVVQAPGTVQKISTSVVLNSTTLGTIQPNQVKQAIEAAVGYDRARGDIVTVNTIPFNNIAQRNAQQELAAANAAAAKAARWRLYRDVGLGAIVALMILLAWIKARRRSKAREQATTYVVEQLRADAAARAAALESANPALEALESLTSEEEAQRENIRQEISEFTDSQPEDAAALLRGWLIGGSR